MEGSVWGTSVGLHNRASEWTRAMADFLLRLPAVSRPAQILSKPMLPNHFGERNGLRGKIIKAVYRQIGSKDPRNVFVFFCLSLYSSPSPRGSIFPPTQVTQTDAPKQLSQTLCSKSAPKQNSQRRPQTKTQIRYACKPTPSHQCPGIIDPTAHSQAPTQTNTGNPNRQRKIQTKETG